MMTNITVHTHALLLKWNRHVTAPTRKLCWFLLLFCGALSAVLTVGNFIFESWHTLYAGMFFLPIALIGGFLLPQFGKAQISAKIQKQMTEDPGTVVNYVFAEDHFALEATTKHRSSTERVHYALIDKVIKIDDTTMYMQSKAGICYLIHEPEGVSEVFRFLYMRTK